MPTSRLVAVAVGAALALLPIAGVAAAQAAAPPDSFSPPTNFPVGLSPFGTALGDVDGDGESDIVTANFYGDSISVLLGNGDGTFGAKADFGAGSEPFRVELADIDGDGNLDAVVTNNGSASVSVLLGAGDGTFGPAVNLSVGQQPRGLALADLDRDGFTDIVATSVTDSVASVLLNNGDGTFAPRVDYDTGGQPSDVLSTDLDFDGVEDLVVSNSTDDTVSVLYGLGDGTFDEAVDFPVGQEPSSVAVGYFDEDFNSYVAVANYADDTVSVLMVDEEGELGPATTVPVGAAPATVRVSDVNQDGNDDIITTNNGSDNISTALGNGDGTFDPARTWATGTGPVGLALGDLDGDVLDDVVTANSTGNSASVLLNTSIVEPTGLVLVPLNPAERLVAGDQFNGPQTRTYNVNDLGVEVPQDVGAVALNLTVADTTAAGNAQVFPGDLPDEREYPTSILNWEAGERLANGASVKVAPDGSFKVRVSSGGARVLVDVVGFYLPEPGLEPLEEFAEALPVEGEGGTFKPLDAPTRVFDSVVPGGLSGVAEVDLSNGGVLFDPEEVVSVVYNVTASATSASGHLRIQPAVDGALLTETSALNWTGAGDVVANSSMVPLGPGGTVLLYVGGAPVRVIIDVQGYFVNDGSGLVFRPIDPQRVLDTRIPGEGGPLGPRESRTVVVTSGIGLFGETVNPSIVPDSAVAVAFNLTEDGGTGRGHFRAFPESPVPLASINNWPSSGHTRANATMLGTASGEDLETYFVLYNSTGNADAIVDVLGYFN